VLWELVTRCVNGKYIRPYQEHKELIFDFQVIIKVAKTGIRPAMHEKCPQSFKELIEQTWTQTPDPRPTCQELLQKLEKIETEYLSKQSEWNALCPQASLSTDE
jgi:hypothetical protein